MNRPNLREQVDEAARLYDKVGDLWRRLESVPGAVSPPAPGVVQS